MCKRRSKSVTVGGRFPSIVRRRSCGKVVAVWRDETDSIDVLIFNNKRGRGIDDCIEQNKGLPAKKNIVWVRGVKSDDGVFANFVTVQDSKIYMKLGQLKNDEKNLD